MSKTAIYDIGDYVERSVTFKVQGTPTNPTTVTITVRKPNGITVEPTPTNPATGVFHFGFDVDAKGLWTYKAVGTGAAKGVEFEEIWVRPNPF